MPGSICCSAATRTAARSAFPAAFPSRSIPFCRGGWGKGAWKHHDMQGYTSVGAGSSVVPVRFNCPPEITLHTLEKI